MLQAKALPLLVTTLQQAQLQGGGTHTYAVLGHAARGLGNFCDPNPNPNPNPNP